MLTRSEVRKEGEDGVVAVLLVFPQILKAELKVLVKVEIIAILELLDD